MKLLKLACLLFSLAAFSIFAGCGDDDGGEGGDTNYIERDYFTVEDGTYVNTSLPSGTTSLVSDFSINKNVVNGGSAIVSFSSAQQLKNLNVGVKGVQGYYQVPLTAISLASSELKSTKAEATYSYQAIIVVNQDISADNFKVICTVTAADGTVSKTMEEDIKVIEAGTGLLQVTLSWDQYDDLDLHVFDPDDNEIYFGDEMLWEIEDYTDEFDFDFACYLVTKYTSNNASDLDYNNEGDHQTFQEYMNDLYALIEEGKLSYVTLELEKGPFASQTQKYKENLVAFLDIDSNAGCGSEIDGINNENIYFNKVKNGTYTVKVDLYEKCDHNKAGAKYSVTMNYKGQPIQFSNKQTGQFAQDNTGNWNESDGLVVIGTFKISDSVNEPVAVVKSAKERQTSPKTSRKFSLKK